MQPLSEKIIRSSFVNASRQEAKKLTLPENFETLGWSDMEYLGWRDPKMPQRGYLVHATAGQVRGILLRVVEGAGKAGNAAMCEMCRDVTLPCAVSMFSVKRSGQSGRDGNTLGTLVCSHFQCSANVRVEPPKNPIHPDPALVVAERILELDARVSSFMQRI